MVVRGWAAPAPWPLPKDEPLLGPGLGMAPSPTRPAHCSFHGDPFGFLPKEDGFPLSVQVVCLGHHHSEHWGPDCPAPLPSTFCHRGQLVEMLSFKSQSNIRHQHVLV